MSSRSWAPPMVNFDLDEFDADGVQVRFAVSPFGASETRANRIRRWENTGIIDPDCPGCKAFYEHPSLNPFAPRHQAGPTCRSGGRPHCTCETCF